MTVAKMRGSTEAGADLTMLAGVWANTNEWTHGIARIAMRGDGGVLQVNITGGDDLLDAKKQMEAAAKAKKSLKAAVDQAEQASGGYRAVGVTPKLSNGHAVAIVTLLKGTQAKSVSESLE